MTLTKSFTYAIVAALVLAIVYMFGALTPRADASVAVTNEYMATSTAASTLLGATISNDILIKTGQGALGSVVITGANTGIFSFYDATTTDVSKRTNNIATSSILIASFPASVAAGTYTFDVQYTNGLLLELTSGNIATSTITYR